MAEVTMPRLSDTMSEGSVGRWLKKPGDRVEKDEVIAEIETDKATMELVAFESGTLQQILVPEGQVVPIGEVIGMIGDGAAPAAAKETPAKDVKAEAKPEAKSDAKAEAKPESRSDAKAETKKPAAADASPKSATGGGAANGTPTTEPAATNGTPASQSADGERIKASPLARRVAEVHGLNLRDVPGTGPGGRILKANVEEFRRKSDQDQAAKPAAGSGAATRPATPGSAPAAAPAPTGTVEPMNRMRRAIARAMTESKPGVPHIYLTAEIDMHAAMALRAQINDSGAVETKLSPNDLIVKAAAKTLAKFPLINASFVTTPDGQPAVVRHPQINVSVAVATDDGLLAPVVKDADKKSVGAIAGEIREMAARARDGKVKQGDLEGATFQTSNLGMFNVTEFVSIITLPQAASLAIGAVRQIPVVRDGQIVIGEIMNVTLSVDHRVADGALAAKFLQELTRLLQAPLSLLL
jgi:pyruvate dehydrogenase E2 component (dihydrolipoamide acetyltransferase)